MKVNEQESQLFSDAIDQINNGMEAIISLYNELEPDQPFIKFDPKVMEKIRKVKDKYGDSFVDQKINTVVKEMIDWLPLDEESTAGSSVKSSDKASTKKTKKPDSDSEVTTE